LLARSAEADMIVRLAVAALDDLMVKARLSGSWRLPACSIASIVVICDLPRLSMLVTAGTRRDAINIR